MHQDPQDALDSLKPAIIRLIITRQKLSKALHGGDDEIIKERIGQLYQAAEDVEDAWTAYEAGHLDEHVSGAVEVAMAQLRLRARHN